MLITTIKIISVLYPFLKELLLGKNTNHKEVRRLKMALIDFIIVSVLLNFYLLKSSYQLSKHKITNSTKVLELEKTITDLNNKLAKTNVTCSNPNPVNNNDDKPKIPINRTPPITRKEDYVIDDLYKKLKHIEDIED